MQYFFIFGNTPALSYAEVTAYLRRSHVPFSVVWTEKDFLIIETEHTLPDTTMQQLGGSIKYGLIETIATTVKDVSVDFFTERIHKAYTSGKYHFGFSVYPRDKQLSYHMRGLGLELKRNLKSMDIASRLVMSKSDNLSSVVVQKNKLVSDMGWEIVLLKTRHDIYIGRTLAVQPFEDFSKRDYGRPDRDDNSGMLPPKLALSMINLAAKPHDAALLDPFCGSGTVLQEALLLGYYTLYGSDVSEKAVHDAKENIQWLAEEKQVDITGVSIKHHDVTKSRSDIMDIDAVVTEPFLGPPAIRRRNKQDVDQIVKQLVPLYTKALENLSTLLADGGRIVMIFPVLFYGDAKHFLSDSVAIPKNLQIQELVPREYRSVYRTTYAGGVLYMREGQHVGREILVLEK